MSNVLPNNDTLVVNGVIYRYTALKDPNSAFIVNVQNKDRSDGYVFRTTDDWTGKPSGTINRLVSLDNIPISLFGDGEIATTGEGSIQDPTVIYTYRYEPKDPSLDFQVPEWDIYNYSDDQAVMDAMRETDPDLYDRDNKKQRNQDKGDRLEKALRASGEALDIASDINQDAIIQAMSGLVKISPYYGKVISGGSYGDSLSIPTTDIPDNKRGLRNNLAQQIKHQQMVDTQYEN